MPTLYDVRSAVRFRILRSTGFHSHLVRFLFAFFRFLQEELSQKRCVHPRIRKRAYSTFTPHHN